MNVYGPHGMRWLGIGGFVALVLAACVSTSAEDAKKRGVPRSSADSSLVLDGVTVIDVEQGKRLSAQRVVITGTRIQTIGDLATVPMPPRARMVGAQGKYLIPGLWDMHVHNEGDLELYASYLALGITGVRDMRSLIPLDSFLQWRREVATGLRPGPRVVAAGRYLDNNPALKAFPTRTPEEGRRAVDSLKAMGVDFVKIHDFQMPREVYFAIVDEARRLGIPFAGHKPQSVTLLEASNSGMRSMEHDVLFTEDNPCWMPDSVRAPQCVELVAALARNGTWLDLTGWHGNFPDSVARVGLEIFRQSLRQFGNPFLLGSDGQLPLPLIVPMTDIHGPLKIFRYLAEFVHRFGLTPLEALQAATLNPAKYLHATDSLGTVTSGKLADLVVLDADPLADIANTTKISAVIANGRYFDRIALDRLMAEAQIESKSLIDAVLRDPSRARNYQPPNSSSSATD